MGRREELSDFQRGTVVGCYMCKKSVREISTLLDLPRSTVSSIILKWKRGGLTTTLPRSGRPHKLREEDRQLLEKVALENCLTSIAALTAEFQAASGASVSAKTVRRELHGMGFRGRVSSYSKKKGGSQAGGTTPPRVYPTASHGRRGFCRGVTEQHRCFRTVRRACRGPQHPVPTGAFPQQPFWRDTVLVAGLRCFSSVAFQVKKGGCAATRLVGIS